MKTGIIKIQLNMRRPNPLAFPKVWSKTGKGQKPHHGSTFTGPVGKLAVGSLATARGGIFVYRHFIRFIKNNLSGL